MLDCTLAADAPQLQPLTYLVPHPSVWKNYQTCPWAKSILVIDPETDDLVLCPVTCKRWGCPYCAKLKIRKLAFLTNGAAPNRMLTLTMDPKDYESPKDAWEKTTDKVPELMRKVRKAYKECEYLRVCELHKSGFPHYHLLLRCPYIPVKPLTDEWAKLTGGTHVKLAKVLNSFSSFRYLVKYLTKLHRIEWTDRHVSYSRGFFRPEDLEKITWPERHIEEQTDEHPWLYLARRYYNDQVGVDESGYYHLPYSFFGTPMDLRREDVGLPPLKSEQPEPSNAPPSPPPRQIQRGFIPDPSAEDFADQSF